MSDFQIFIDPPFSLSLRMCDLCGRDAGVHFRHRHSCDDHSPVDVCKPALEYNCWVCTACNEDIKTVNTVKNRINVEKTPF